MASLSLRWKLLHSVWCVGRCLVLFPCLYWERCNGNKSQELGTCSCAISNLVCCTAILHCKASWLCFIAGSVAAIGYLSQKDLLYKKSFGCLLGKEKNRKKKKRASRQAVSILWCSAEHCTAMWGSEKSSGASTPGGENHCYSCIYAPGPEEPVKQQMGNQQTKIQIPPQNEAVV